MIPLIALSALETLCALKSLGALWSLKSLIALRSRESLRSLIALVARDVGYLDQYVLVESRTNLCWLNDGHYAICKATKAV